MSVQAEQIAVTLQNIQARIAAACARSQRNANDVHLIAVTKYATISETTSAVDCGCTKLGESKWPDYMLKWETIGSRVEWHFIGHLQTNKVKPVVQAFDYIHSLDRHSLAKELSKQAVQADKIINAFIQVNVSGEESKYGLAPDQVADFLKTVQALPGIRVVGFMTMAPFEEDAENTRVHFRRLRELRDQLQSQTWNQSALECLSMGMSNDFEVAIEEGATHIRIGSLLFE